MLYSNMQNKAPFSSQFWQGEVKILGPILISLLDNLPVYPDWCSILTGVFKIKCIFLKPISWVVMFQQSKCQLRKQTFVSLVSVFTQKHLIPYCSKQTFALGSKTAKSSCSNISQAGWHPFLDGAGRADVRASPGSLWPINRTRL
jgi:hypothetical protein